MKTINRKIRITTIFFKRVFRYIQQIIEVTALFYSLEINI